MFKINYKKVAGLIIGQKDQWKLILCPIGYQIKVFVTRYPSKYSNNRTCLYIHTQTHTEREVYLQY